jgi:hypothetical protein
VFPVRYELGFGILHKLSRETPKILHFLAMVSEVIRLYIYNLLWRPI